MITLRVAALAGKLGSSTKGAVDARAGVIATDWLVCLSWKTDCRLNSLFSTLEIGQLIEHEFVVGSSYLELAIVVPDTPV